MAEAESVILEMGDQYWLKQLPKFKELQILNIQKLAPGIPTINRNGTKILRNADIYGLSMSFSISLTTQKRSLISHMAARFYKI